MLLWMMIQILIESLPISSSGHVMLLQRWYSTIGTMWPEEQIEQINFLLHAPALIIMFCYFFSTWSYMLLGKQLQLQDFFKKITYQKLARPAFFIFLTDGITIICWKLGLFKNLGMSPYCLTFGFIITAIILYATRYMNSNIPMNFVWWRAIILGIAQSIAFFPGISRFATTFFAARCLQYSLQNSFAISFMIQFPLVCAAFVSSSVQIYHNGDIWYQMFNFWTLFVMVGLSFLSYMVFCYVGKMIQQNKIWYFSIYMMLPIIISILL